MLDSSFFAPEEIVFKVSSSPPCAALGGKNAVAPKFLSDGYSSKPSASIQDLAKRLRYNDARPVFLTLSDEDFFDDVYSSQWFLQNEQLLVICLSSSCMESCGALKLCLLSNESNHRSKQNKSEKAQSLGQVKFDAVFNLTASGYSVLYFDLDVYIVKNPLDAMLPLHDESWDIQVDPEWGQHLNFGWFWSKSNAVTTPLWLEASKRAYASEEWDQTIFDDVFLNAETKGILRIHRLPLDKFGQYQRIGFREAYYADFPEDYVPSSPMVAFHFTCVLGPVKRFLAKTFGAYRDRSYYCRHRRIVEFENEFWYEIGSNSPGQSLDILFYYLDSGFDVLTPKFMSIKKANEFLWVPWVRVIDLKVVPRRSQFLEHNFLANALRECGQVTLLHSDLERDGLAQDDIPQLTLTRHHPRSLAVNANLSINADHAKEFDTAGGILCKSVWWPNDDPAYPQCAGHS